MQFKSPAQRKYLFASRSKRTTEGAEKVPGTPSGIQSFAPVTVKQSNPFGELSSFLDKKKTKF